MKIGWKSKVLVLLVVLLATVFFADIGLFGSRLALAATPASGLAVTSEGCSDAFPGQTVVTFHWQPPGGGKQWLDLSLYNNGFVPGTFGGAGPLLPNVSSFAWDGLSAATTFYFRINTLTKSGWITSETVSFTTGNCTDPDGSPSSPIFYQQVCSDTEPGKIAVDFRWQPSGGGSQWLDLSLLDNGFAPDTFVGWGPWSASTVMLTWDGLSPGQTYYFRINTATDQEWRASQTVAIFTGMCPNGAKWPLMGNISAGGGNKIILTFDDCGNPPVGVVWILDILHTYGARGIFFTTGACVHLYPSVFDRVIAEGHLIGNHTYDHPLPGLICLSLEQARWQIENGPWQAHGGYWRPPGGDHNAAIDAIASDLGYTLMMWDIDTNDWRGRSAAEIVNTVLSQARPGAVVLMHVHAAHTPEALPTIIESLQAAGYVISW